MNTRKPTTLERIICSLIFPLPLPAFVILYFVFMALGIDH